MATTYTLDQAAEKLGISPEELKKRLQTEWTHIRPMRDRGTILLKVKDVDELARQLGFGSEEELQMADPSSSEHSIPSALTRDPGSSSADMPLVLGDKDVFLMADEPKPAAKPPASPAAKGGSDSDVRLEKSVKARAGIKSGDGSGTEEIELDVLPPAVSPSGKLTGSGKMTSSASGKHKAPEAPKPASGKKQPVPPPSEADSSEFELSLASDSSDEFELSLASDSSDEISLGDIPAPAAKAKGGQSGINLGKPSDSGPSLEKKAGGSSGKLKDKKGGGSSGKLGKPARPGSEDEIDFELSLDQPGSSGRKSGPKKKVDSESEFELTLDDASGLSAADLEAETATFDSSASDAKKDIFETDFEIPALDDDSASEAVAIDEADTDLESSSDFDLAIDEADVSVDDDSASQVVVLDDETEPPARSKKATKVKKTTKTRVKPSAVEVEEDVEVSEESVVVDDDAVSFDDMELDESESASKALRGAAVEVDEEEEEKGQTVVVQTANWGIFPALLMLPTVFIIFLGGIMAYELVHSMWGYHQPTKPASLVMDNVAKTFDLNPKE